MFKKDNIVNIVNSIGSFHHWGSPVSTMKDFNLHTKGTALSQQEEAWFRD